MTAHEPAVARCMLTTDRFGAVREHQQLWSLATGLSFEQYEKWGWINAIEPTDRNRAHKCWREIVREMQPASFQASLFNGDSQQYEPAYWMAAPLLGEDLELRHWILTVFNAPPQSPGRTFEREIGKAPSSDESAFADDLRCIEKLASHDMRSPLRKIGNYASLILEDAEDLLPQQEIDRLHAILKSASQMQKYVHGLQEYTALCLRNVELQSISAAECLARAIGSLSQAIHESRFVVSSHELPDVWGNAKLLQFVFESLLRNAISNCGEKSPLVKVDCEVDADKARFVVRDRGIGIDPTDYPSIFQPFRRGASQAKTSGIGLGLAICKRALMKMGGDISLLRTKQGASFVVQLPLANAASSVPPVTIQPLYATQPIV